VEELTKQALGKAPYDVIVVGAGLQTLPPMALQFERLMNVLHQHAPKAKLGFNTQPGDSDAAAAAVGFSQDGRCGRRDAGRTSSG
jgi:hypothetical protein